MNARTGETASEEKDRRALTPRERRMLEMLERLYAWDHMDTAADGAYWRKEILALIAEMEAEDGK